MATQTLVLPDAGSNSSTSYAVRSTKNNGITYVATNGSLSAPKTVDVLLHLKGAGVVGNERFHVSIKHVVLDSMNLPRVSSLTMQLSIAKDPAQTAARTKDLLSEGISYLGGSKAFSIEGITDTSGFPDSICSMLIP